MDKTITITLEAPTLVGVGTGTLTGNLTLNADGTYSGTVSGELPIGPIGRMEVVSGQVTIGQK